MNERSIFSQFNSKSQKNWLIIIHAHKFLYRQSNRLYDPILHSNLTGQLLNSLFYQKLRHLQFSLINWIIFQISKICEVLLTNFFHTTLLLQIVNSRDWQPNYWDKFSFRSIFHYVSTYTNRMEVGAMYHTYKNEKNTRKINDTEKMFFF